MSEVSRDYSKRPAIPLSEFFTYVKGKKIRWCTWPSMMCTVPEKMSTHDPCIFCSEEGGEYSIFNGFEPHCDSYWELVDPVPVVSEKSKEIVASLRPSYYKPEGIEVWDFILSNDIPFIEGNIIKYIARWREKGGIEDLRKAQTYLEKLISSVQEDEQTD